MDPKLRNVRLHKSDSVSHQRHLLTLLVRYSLLYCVHTSVIWFVCQRVTIIVSKLILSFITVLTVYFSFLTGEYHTLLFPMMVLLHIREYSLAV